MIFNKLGRTGESSTSQTAANEPAPRRKGPKVASLIVEGVIVEGNVTSDGDIHLDGTIRGDVRAQRVSVGERGRVEGAIHAEIVEARGRVIGSITAKQVKLTSTSHVDGDIAHEQLTMETGAAFQGRSLLLHSDVPPVAELSPFLKLGRSSDAVTLTSRQTLDLPPLDPPATLSSAAR
jgi:cytoskeletal protein CcmA (bactofilin family)